MGVPRYAPNPLRVDHQFEPPPHEPLAFHRTLDGYQATPLRSAPRVAEQLAATQVWVKDESNRLGMPSFKILGASWAIYRALTQRLGVPSDPVIPIPRLRDLLGRDRPLELVAATDGNHGRAVARMAALLGLTAHILVPDDMTIARRTSIASEGARVTVVHGTYDDAVACSAALADDRHIVISDTAWEGYDEIPRWVIDGYATIGLEVDGQLTKLGSSTPTVLAVQMGVGAFAAAMIRYARTQPGATILGVEPASADCVFASIEAGAPVEVPGPHNSIMAGLNCGKASPIAWPTVSRGLDAIIAIDDEDSRRAMRILAEDGVTSGESGAAGLAGLLAARRHVELTRDATVLVVSTEGATDLDAYMQVINSSQTSAGRRT